MISDEQLRRKIKSYHRRKSKNHVRYYANGFGKDHIIWRSLCALYTQERIEKDQKRYLTVNDMIWLIAMKQFVVESGKDTFFMRDIRRFIDFHFKQRRSALNAVNVSNKLLKAGYITNAGPTKMWGYMLTMKARAFYRDLEDLISI